MATASNGILRSEPSARPARHAQTSATAATAHAGTCSDSAARNPRSRKPMMGRPLERLSIWLDGECLNAARHVEAPPVTPPAHGDRHDGGGAEVQKEAAGSQASLFGDDQVGEVRHRERMRGEACEQCRLEGEGLDGQRLQPRKENPGRSNRARPPTGPPASGTAVGRGAPRARPGPLTQARHRQPIRLRRRRAGPPTPHLERGGRTAPRSPQPSPPRVPTTSAARYGPPRR